MSVEKEMYDMVRFSVVVPVYNGERWLERCLDSIVCSIGEAKNWEIVCVDDASTDASADVLSRFAAHVTIPCRLVRHDVNRGSGEARNTGLERARGEWIAWVDADDRVCPDWAPRIAQELKQVNDVDVLCFGARMWKDNFWRAMRYDNDSVCVPGNMFLCDILRDIGSSTWMWNKVFRKSLFRDLYFSGRCQEDFRLMPGIMRNARHVKSIPDLLYDYFRPVGSLSRHGDRTGSVDGLKLCLNGLKGMPGTTCWANFPRVEAAWKEGCVLRVADYLRNSGLDDDFRRFLRRNLWRVLLDRRQSLKAKAKCVIAAI